MFAGRFSYLSVQRYWIEHPFQGESRYIGLVVFSPLYIAILINSHQILFSVLSLLFTPIPERLSSVRVTFKAVVLRGIV